jgi:hypothetical protein
MAKPNWTRIAKLNEGAPVYFAAPPLDTKDEVWFYAKAKSFGHTLRVWSSGTLAVDASKNLPT